MDTWHCDYTHTLEDVYPVVTSSDCYRITSIAEEVSVNNFPATNTASTTNATVATEFGFAFVLFFLGIGFARWIVKKISI